ncbi:hypothetical protein [Psychrobacter sp. DAB_AL32B]|uniref:hypothetical protein n=1 Tax=Psychrobacter sp. DAB_AL32B TaxID=1028414 RepID=UPI000B7F46FC|nr:hypothetical protein [Psychrobacter sp. DAB_AL32B]OXL21845.1 hypothetical protein CAN34_09000 [Psychrobacter sp. DAB_AL32B]
MSDIEVSTTVTASSYPKWKVIAQYLLLGGVVGSIGMLLILLITMIFTEKIGEVAEYGLEAIVLIMLVIVVGFFAGLIPSLIAALIITKLKIYFDSILKIIPLFIIGFFSGFACACFMIITEGFLGALRGMSVYGFIGGFSAVVTGWLVLPKQK